MYWGRVTHSLVVLQAQVSGTGHQHDPDVLHRPLYDVHEMVQVAGGRLGGVGEERIVKVHTERLWQVVVTKRKPAL